MFLRAPRKTVILSGNTPENVCPNTYMIDEDRYIRKNAVPFLSGAKPKSDVTIYTDVLYYPTYDSHRIKYGNSLKFTGKRETFVPLQYEVKPSRKVCNCAPPEECKEKKGGKGKLYVCHVPFTIKSKPRSIPYIYGVNGYLIENDEIIEIPPYDYDRTIGPAFYNVPRDEVCFNTKKYKGCEWSKRSSKRVTIDIADSPSPFNYTVKFNFCPGHDAYNFMREYHIRNSKSLRYTDELRQRCIRENLPGPAHYDVKDIDKIRPVKGCVANDDQIVLKWKKEQEKGLRVPGPQTYNSYESFTVNKSFNVRKTPFMFTEERFQKKSEISPGPGMYEPEPLPHVEYGTKKAPFCSTSERKSIYEKDDDFPAPNIYDVTLCEKRCTPIAILKSRVPRFQHDKQGTTEGVPMYDTSKAYKCMHDRKSHNAGNVPFHSSQDKFSKMYDYAGAEAGLGTPGVGTYNIGDTIPDILAERRNRRRRMRK